MKLNLKKISKLFLKKHIVVIGDVMIDKYLEGDVSRIVKESPKSRTERHPSEKCFYICVRCWFQESRPGVLKARNLYVGKPLKETSRRKKAPGKVQDARYKVTGSGHKMLDDTRLAMQKKL